MLGQRSMTELIGFLTAVLVLATGAIVLFRQVVGAYSDRLDQYKERASELGTEKDELQKRLATREAELKHLRSFPFGEEVSELVNRVDAAAGERTKQAASMLAAQHAEIEVRMNQSFAHHEERAQERHQAQIEVNQAMLRALSRIMNDVRGRKANG